MKHNLSKGRNAKLIEEYEKGTKIRLMEAYFKISRQRIYQILDENNVKKRSNLDNTRIRVYDLRKQGWGT